MIRNRQIIKIARDKNPWLKKFNYLSETLNYSCLTSETNLATISLALPNNIIVLSL